jgi:hypothetical protein
MSARSDSICLSMRFAAAQNGETHDDRNEPAGTDQSEQEPVTGATRTPGVIAQTGSVRHRDTSRVYMLPRPRTYGIVRRRILMSVHSDQFAT